MSDTIDSTILETPVRGVNLQPGTLADQLGQEPVLALFLRHFGCIFCRETIADVRKVSEARPDYPAVLFFFQGSS